MLVLLVAGLARAECPEDALATAIRSATEIESAFANLDDARFDAAHTRLKEAIPCITVELAPSDAVAIHRARAIGAFVDGDDATSRKSWLAVRDLQPDWKPSAALMPEGHPMRQLWEAPVDQPTPEVPLKEAPKGGWNIDGTRQNGVPTYRAFILQGFDETGTGIYTGYLYSNTEIPTLGVEMVPSERVSAVPVDRTKRRNTIRRWGSVGAGVLAAGSVGSFVVAMDAQSRLENDFAADGTDHDYTPIAGWVDRQNTFATVGTGLGAAAVGTATIVWAVPW